METFMAVYAKHLEKNVRDDPGDYGYGPDSLPEVIRVMKLAIKEGTFNKDSKSFRQTCRELKINHTYKAIAHFLANHV